MRIVVLGLSITSSWGNGHATTWRALLRALAARGHDVLFLERDVDWYRENRDLASPPYARVVLYDSLAELGRLCAKDVREADLVIVGSYVPEGVAVADWALRTARGTTAFYDIDTPVTLAKLARGDYEYLSPELIPRFDLYLSFTGGPTLDLIAAKYGARMPRALYCSVDPQLYYPEEQASRWKMGYLGTYSEDRQPGLERLLLEPARCDARGKYVVAGPMYPPDVEWPANVERIEHLPPAEHRWFYNSQQFTLNITRADMIKAGYSPSVRLFEAAACGVPIISDPWPGLATFFEIGKELLVAHDSAEVEKQLADTNAAQRVRIGMLARRRVLDGHTSQHRALQLEQYVRDVLALAEPVRRATSTPLRLRTEEL